MATKTQISNQLYHNTLEPLDSTLQVENLSELQNPSVVQPYVGKLVHVKSTHTIYACADVTIPTAAVWRPVLAENGTALYLSTEAGETFKITVTRDGGNTGRIVVDYPVVIRETPTA